MKQKKTFAPKLERSHFSWLVPSRLVGNFTLSTGLVVLTVDPRGVTPPPAALEDAEAFHQSAALFKEGLVWQAVFPEFMPLQFIGYEDGSYEVAACSPLAGPGQEGYYPFQEASGEILASLPTGSTYTLAPATSQWGPGVFASLSAGTYATEVLNSFALPAGFTTGRLATFRPLT